jgi:hypothetical protein
LAATDLHAFFAPHEFDSECLLLGHIQNAWAGAYIFYGPRWKPEINLCFDISSGIAKPTDWWTTIARAEILPISPFRPSEIFSDDAGSMHDLERHLRNKFGINTDKHLADPKEWMAAFKKHRKDLPTRSTLIRLAITPISVFGPDCFADR